MEHPVDETLPDPSSVHKDAILAYIRVYGKPTDPAAFAEQFRFEIESLAGGEFENPDLFDAWVLEVIDQA